MSDNPNLYNTIYNPDVLSCIANLSNDEVFTPPEVANAMLDMLPQELFSNPNAKFLDPACKSGVFLREIAKRLLIGLEGQIPDLQERVDHIFHYQLYGIAITELTSLLARRSLYCSKYPNSVYSVSRFDDAEGNIRFKNTPHKWKDGRCEYCGASESEYGSEKRKGLETHAYEFIHTIRPEEILKMKFDVIIGNPPYQLSDGGNSASAIPIYHLFVEQAKKLNPRFLTMVIPARWFMGGRGLDAFRDTMLHDNRIRIIHDYPNASDCFPGVEIKGGICYFLWDRDNRGLCSVYSHLDNKVRESIRPLLEEGMDTFIRNDTQISVLNKVKQLKESSFSDILNAGRFFGFHTKISWEKDSIYGTIQSADGKDYYPISKEQNDRYDVKIYIHGGVCWISQNDIPKNASYIHKYKILIPRSGNPGGSILGKPKISEPNSCSSNTYVVAIPNDTELSEKTAQNMITYIQTRFFRYLVAIKTSTQDMAPRAYSFVPVQDFSRSWTDEALFTKYNLSEEEIQEIESTIPEMILD